MKESKLPVTKLFRKVVLPILQYDGFIEFSGKKFGRIVDNYLFQFMILYVEAISRRELSLEFGIMLLGEPHVELLLAPGGKFPEGRFRKRYLANSEERLSNSLNNIVNDYNSITQPWFVGCTTTSQFITTFQTYLDQRPYLIENGHSLFSLACAHSLTGNREMAKSICEKAMTQFQKIYEEQPLCSWADDGVKKCAFFLKALECKEEQALHDTWRRDNINKFGLDILTNRK